MYLWEIKVNSGYPFEHIVQFAAPSFEEYYPVGQSRQSVNEICPVKELNEL